jgi:hypothetical protein
MMQKINVRVVAFMLLLAFVQKLGLELWLHDWLHVPQGVHALAPGDRDKASLQQSPVQCHCLDDTLMPLIGSASFTYAALHKHWTSLQSSGHVCALSIFRIFSSLRGPPAGVSL